VKKTGFALSLMLIGAILPNRGFAEDNVTLALNWIVSGKHAGYYVAMDKGWYKDAGLNVTISRGRGSGDTLNRIAVGESMVGLVDTATLISGIARSKMPVKGIALVAEKSAVAVLYAGESGIKVPKDLEGKKLGRSASGASVIMFPGFLKANGVDDRKIHEIVATTSTFLPMLLSRHVDAVLEQSSNLARYRKAAVGQNLHIAAFTFADYGFTLLGDQLVVTEETLKTNPKVLRRFLTATFKGMQYAFEHPKEAIKMTQRHDPEVETDVAVAELLDTKRLAMTPTTKKHYLGYIDRATMVEAIKSATDALKLPRKVAPEEVYTLDLLN